MVLEIAKSEDFHAVNRLARQVCEHHAQWDKSIQLVDEPYPLDWFQECIRADALHENVIYVARNEGNVVGFVRFYLWETNSTVSAKRKMLSIDDIGVDCSLRNQGIGQEMMKHLCAMAKSWGCDSIHLYVDAENESAYRYYLKCGFHVRNMGMGLKLEKQD